MVVTLTKNKASLQKLPGKSQFQEKNSGYYCWKLKKKESKTLKTFQKLLEQISQGPLVQSEQAELSSRGNVYEQINQKLHISGNTGRVPYLNNPSEETTFVSNKIKE